MSTDAILRVVVDTNLFVGWLFHPSAPGPGTVMDRWRGGEIRLCVSAEVLQEVSATLGRLPVSAARKDEILDRLTDPEHSEAIESPPDSGFRCADPADDKFLHLALAANADALITSDRALLEVAGFPIPIEKSGQWVRRVGR